ncbi:MAG: preprotein translocase subunit SecG [Clostridium sp.]|uniref:preprotein translocase subunit SecG n=1 Tax=Clostridium sp. TaxID=1506 RepID=UPI0030394D29
MITALKVVLVISALVVIISIALQESKSSGLGGLVAGTSETFYSKNKTKTKDSLLVRITIVSAVVFAVTTVGINILL